MSLFKNKLNKILIQLKLSKLHRQRILDFIPDGTLSGQELKDFLVSGLEKSGLPNWKNVYIEINKRISFENPQLIGA
jgi:hypothetical protein